MTDVSAKQKIKNALVSLMIYKPLESITITDITKEAKVNKSTYYYHYYKKEEILYEITNKCISDLIMAMKSPYKGTHELKINENILPSTVNLFEHVYQQKDYYFVLLNYEKGLAFQNELLNVIINFFINETNPIYTENINNDINPIFQAYGIFGIITAWINDDCKQPPKLVAKQLTNILFYILEKVQINY